MRLKSTLFVLAIAFGSAIAGPNIAQEKPPAEMPAPVQADPQVKAAARGLIDAALKASHAADIFADLRRTLKEVYIPAVRDTIEGNVPGAPALDAKSAAALAKLLTVMDYTRKAGDDLDAALSDNREAMISDAAEQIAKTVKPADIKDVQAIFALPAVKKGFDAFYAVSKLVTGFSYGDARKFSDFSAWAQGLGLQQGLPGSGGQVPTKRRIAKAQALMDDLLSVSHLDDMARDTIRFVRDVYAETAPMTEREREDLREEADQLEFTYNFQKAILLAAAPSVVAAALTDEQLSQLHGFVRSPAFAKAFDLLRNAVKACTAFTKEDLLEAQRSFETLQKKAEQAGRSTAEEDQVKAEWKALAEKWTQRLNDRISPETRQGLQQALEDLQNSGSPI